jgi:hypothetical protein
VAVQGGSYGTVTKCVTVQQGVKIVVQKTTNLGLQIWNLKLHNPQDNPFNFSDFFEFFLSHFFVCIFFHETTIAYMRVPIQLKQMKHGGRTTMVTSNQMNATHKVTIPPKGL